MIRKYHNDKPQTNPWHREEGPHDHQETPERQTMQSNQLSLFPINMIAKLEWTISNVQKHGTITDSHKWSYNKQKVNNNRATALERTAA